MSEPARDETLQIRKLWLDKLLKRSADRIIHNYYHHDPGAIGPLLLRQACLMGLEGIVSKHRDSSYKGPSKRWIKVKNPKSPAMRRAEDGNWRHDAFF
jgi:bifunctional non-homologous end joining protein LigD